MQRIIDYWKKNDVWFLGMIVGSITFVFVFGTKVLHTTYTDWLLGGGNITENYLGWCFFRNSDWFFPIGLMDNISYPNTVSVIYTDSVPLLAVFFKLFKQVLPDEFQYFGIWNMLCMGLQGAFGALLVYHFVKKKAVAVVGSIFFVIAPVILVHMSLNFALGAQWLILFSLYVGIKRESMNFKKSIITWGFVGFLAGSIQLYFIPICGIVFLGFFGADIIKREKVIHTLLMFLVYLCMAITTVAFLGGFSHFHLPKTTLLGQGSYNLNGLLNPQGWSSIIPSFTVYGENPFEGLAYPGTGILLTFILGTAFWLSHNICQTFMHKDKCYQLHEGNTGNNRLAFFILIVASFLIAVSPWVALGNKLLLKLGIPDWLHSIWLRIGNCGRFIWPVVYLAILGSIVWLEKKIPWKNVAVIMLVILALAQIIDEKWQLIQRKVQFGTDYRCEKRLEDEVWREWAGSDEIEHIVFASNILNDEQLVYSLSIYAAQNELTVDCFKSSCQTIRTITAKELSKALADVRKDTLYIYKESDKMQCNDTRMDYKSIDGLIIGTVK